MSRNKEKRTFQDIVLSEIIFMDLVQNYVFSMKLSDGMPRKIW